MSGCYLNKLMIVNNCLCSSHQMFGRNSPNHKLMLNLTLDIMLEMLIYTNDILMILVFKGGGGILGEECNVIAILYSITPYAALVHNE